MPDDLPNLKPGEAEAIAATKAKVAEKYENMFSYMRELDRMDAAGLTSCGYRNGPADAIHRTFKSTQKEIDKLWADFLRKFPD